MSDVGRRFAYRERARSPGEPVRPVEVVKEGPPRSNNAKVRRLDGEYEGLVGVDTQGQAHSAVGGCRGALGGRAPDVRGARRHGRCLRHRAL